MIKRDDIIRVGDRVRIVTPEVMVRVGYPMTYEDARKEVEDRYRDQLVPIIADMYGKSAIDPHDEFNSLMAMADLANKRVYRNVIRELAHGYLRAKNFGGNKRRVHTRTVPELAGEIRVVKRLTYHKTGDYYPPSGGYDEWSMEYDYEPGGLENMKTHKFVDVCPNTLLRPDAKDAIWLEVCNVEKIRDNGCEPRGPH